MYSDFASAYDRIMSDFDYAAAADYLISTARLHGCELKKPLDLACGSGTLAHELVRRGLDSVCVDASPDMLSLARLKLPADTLVICQPMQELDLNDTVDVCFCCMDSINYVTSKADLKRAIGRVSTFTDKDGLFIFDVNTEYKFTKLLGDNVYTYDYDDLFLIWKSGYDKKSRCADYEITWFVKSSGSGMWQRYDDCQRQRFWADDTLRSLLSEAGFILCAVYDAYTLLPATEKCERLHYVWRKL